MEEVLTTKKIAEILNISDSAVKTRFRRKGIAPCEYIGSAGRYTAADIEAIRDGGTRGRPKSDVAVSTPDKATPKSKAKKTKK